MNRIAVAKSEKKFQAKLEKAVEDIRAEANGRICGQCAHFCRSFCMRPDLEDDVEIHTPDAVACNRFEAMVDKRKARHRR